MSRRRLLLAAGVSAVLTVVGLLSLWGAPPPPDVVPRVIGELVLGSGFAVAAPAILATGRGSGSGRLFLLGAVLLLLAPPIRAAGWTVAADVTAVLAGAVAIPLGLLRVVERDRRQRALRGVDALVAVSGLVCAMATAVDASAAGAGAAQVGGVGLLLGGWVQFELTAGDRRRALLWVVLGLSGSVLAFLTILFATLTSGLGVAALALLACAPGLLLPLTAAVAVVAPRVVDVREVISRATVYGVMFCLVLAVHGGVEAVLGAVIGAPPGKVVQGVLVALIAAGFHPTLVRVRTLVDELLFGGRADPVDTLTRLNTELVAGSEPQEWLDTLRVALGVPWLALRAGDRELAESGGAVDGRPTEVVPLRTRSTHVGDLVVALPPEQLRIAPPTATVLGLIAVPLAQALHAVQLGEQLRASRSRAVEALEDQRRRIRRDLHDGLGPTLSGIAYSADAVANLVGSDPEEAADVVRGLRADAAEAIAEIRRIVHGLRPRALDELGLVAAVRQQVSRMRAADGRPLRVEVTAAEPLTELPAALEVVAYRVAVEAVTNVARHAGVAAAEVEFALHPEGSLDLTVRDHGCSTQPWQAGVGLESMRERVEEIGGTLLAHGGSDGGLVSARLPLGPAPRGDGLDRVDEPGGTAEPGPDDEGQRIGPSTGSRARGPAS